MSHSNLLFSQNRCLQPAVGPSDDSIPYLFLISLMERNWSSVPNIWKILFQKPLDFHHLQDKPFNWLRSHKFYQSSSPPGSGTFAFVLFWNDHHLLLIFWRFSITSANDFGNIWIWSRCDSILILNGDMTTMELQFQSFQLPKYSIPWDVNNIVPFSSSFIILDSALKYFARESSFDLFW